jgi:long-chain acyl-CoA synthetase
VTRRIWDHRRTAALAPSKCAVAADGGSLSYRELVEHVDIAATALQRLGVHPGQVVSTDLPVGPELFALALACLEQGFGCFPVPLNMMPTDADQALARVALHVTNAPTGGTQLRFAELSQHGDGPRSRPGTAAGFIVYATSGTTGMQRVAQKRPLRFPYRGVHRRDEYGAGVEYGLHLMTNPSYHRGTLGPALYSLQAGSGVAVMRRFTPESFAEHIDEFLVDSTFLMSARIRRVLDSEVRPRHRLRSFQHGAVRCPAAVKQRAIERFGPVLHEYYATADLMISEIGTAE